MVVCLHQTFISLLGSCPKEDDRERSSLLQPYGSAFFSLQLLKVSLSIDIFPHQAFHLFNAVQPLVNCKTTILLQLELLFHMSSLVDQLGRCEYLCLCKGDNVVQAKGGASTKICCSEKETEGNPKRWWWRHVHVSGRVEETVLFAQKQ